MNDTSSTAYKKRVVVLISGYGSNLQALIDHQADTSYEIVGVISNNPDASGLDRARQYRIAALGLDSKCFSSRSAFDMRLIEEINRFEPDLIVLAGYMKILTPEFVERFNGKIINVHPSLLPDYKGLGTYQRVLADRKTEHGCTVHFVTADVDCGAQIIQSSLAIHPTDTESSLKRRVQAMEHIVLPMAVDWFCSGRLQKIGVRLFLDHKPIAERGYPMTEALLMEEVVAE